MLSKRVERMVNGDGTFSHYAVCMVNENGDVLDTVTGEQHMSREEAETELVAITND